MAITTYTPSAASALFNAFAGVAFDDPKAYISVNGKRIDAKYFLVPVQSELLNINKILSAGGGAILVRNATGGTLAAGPVSVSNLYNNDPTTTNAIWNIVAADASGDTKVAHALLLSSLANNTTGVAYAGGFMPFSGFSTVGASAGDPVYVAAGGGMTLTAPSGSDQFVQIVARVSSISANGDLYGYVNPPRKIGSSWLQSGAMTFDKIGTGVNATATMTVGTGASLTFSGTGSVNASLLSGALVPTGASLNAGDLMYASNTGTWQNLPGNVATSRKFLQSVGNGSAVTSIGWVPLASTDLPLFGYVVKSAAYSVVSTDNQVVFDVDASGSVNLPNITLPAAATVGAGFKITIGKADSTTANPIPITVNSADGIDGAAYITKTITNVARTGTLVTITTSAAHGFISGMPVTITAGTNTSVNGTWVITNQTSTTFTYTDTTSGTISSADTGTCVPATTALTQQHSKITLVSTGVAGSGAKQGWTVVEATDYLSSAVGNTNLAGVNTATGLVQLSIPPGDWDISANCQWGGSGTTPTLLSCNINTTVALGSVGDNRFDTFLTGAAAVSAAVPAWRFSTTTWQSVVLVAQVNAAGGTVNAAGRISARRAGR